jgi:hypothetical protein
MTESKLWALQQPHDSTFAWCWLRSPPEEIEEPCGQCQIRTVYRESYPLELEWEVGSDQVGDFSWPGGGRIAVTATVARELCRRFPGLGTGPVNMIQDPRLRRPKTRRPAKPRVWLPYEGPPLVELLVTTFMPALPGTTTKVRHRCAHCGAEARSLIGVEEKGHRWDIRQEKLRVFHRRRRPGQGLYLAKRNLGRAGILRCTSFPQAIVCTDEARDVIVRLGPSNVDFIEFGSLL